MGFRFRRSIKILPGVRLNFGKRGISTSIGIRGAHVTVGKTGTRTTVGPTWERPFLHALREGTPRLAQRHASGRACYPARKSLAWMVVDRAVGHFDRRSVTALSATP